MIPNPSPPISSVVIVTVSRRGHRQVHHCLRCIRPPPGSVKPVDRCASRQARHASPGPGRGCLFFQPTPPSRVCRPPPSRVPEIKLRPEWRSRGGPTQFSTQTAGFFEKLPKKFIWVAFVPIFGLTIPTSQDLGFLACFWGGGPTASNCQPSGLTLLLESP